MNYFNYATGLTMTNKKFSELFKNPVRDSEKDLLTQFHMDVAASIQAVIEKIVIMITDTIANEYKVKNLCLAGGVALNCVANGKILKRSNFKNIWIQPASGDAGGSLGAALAFWFKELKKERIISNEDKMKGSYLGPSFENEEIEKDLNHLQANFKKLGEEEMISTVAKELSNQKIVGWFQGRMEFGPRALGCRSIIADPRSEFMQKELNLKVKFRESFRPFAPSILFDDVSKWFDLNVDSPYMLLVAKIKKEIQLEMNESEKKLFGIEKLNIKRSTIPAVTHIDYSARVQTVHKETNLKFYNLISKFKEITKCPVLVNTSFNVRGEPIVCSIKNAFDCFMGTNIDILVCENFIMHKSDQKKNLIKDYSKKFKLD
tara:strand:- start:68 stop:1192 length:1125 start_codon:yes stop_codon:yes gene_type:complete